VTPSAFERFDLTGKLAVITGGAGLLGREHAAAICEAGGLPILWDIDGDGARTQAAALAKAYGRDCGAAEVDLTQPDNVAAQLAALIKTHGRVDILINNAARDPKVDRSGVMPPSRLEAFPLDEWHRDLAVGLTAAFLCSQAIGTHMANTGGGVILNIASDLGIIAPDQRLYRNDGAADDQQPVKAVTYSVVKHGLIGLTRYLATYWPERGVRANALCPGGVQTDQPDAFVEKLTNLIPMGRMARPDEYRGAIQFLCSDASVYMNGACVSMDGGRTTW
jgi:NAD(P)-dependent dehydrogenase (short-subunit alcohol dehydrogenase family)